MKCMGIYFSFFYIWVLDLYLPLINPFKFDFTIVNFIHYKLRIAVPILDF